MSANTVFITGVGRGLGRALAERYLNDGHRVYGSTNRTPSDLDLAGHVRLDLSDPASVHAAATELADRTSTLDVLINCAGVDARAFGAAEDGRDILNTDADTLNAVLNVNATGPLTLTNALLPLLRAGTNPMIVNVSSQLGSMEVASAMGRDAAYCISKAALNMVSVKMATALKPDGIAVITLHPGWVQTDMGGPSATLTMDESASAIADAVGQLSIEDSGCFIRWDGTTHPW